MKKIILAAAVAMISTPVAANGLKLMCKTETQMACYQNNECSKSPNPSKGRIIDFPKNQLHRCHTDGCDPYKIRGVTKSVDRGTTYINVFFGGGGALRVNTSTMGFVETGILGLSVAITRGTCK